MSNPTIIHKQNGIRIVKEPTDDNNTLFTYEEKAGKDAMGETKWTTLATMTQNGPNYGNVTVIAQTTRTGKSFKSLVEKLEEAAG